MTLVIDASVALAWFVAEAGSASAQSALSGGDTLIAPDFLLAEVANATWKAVRTGAMSAAQQDAALLRLPALIDEWVAGAGLLPRAAVISRLLDHPAYDCFYLALAEQRQATLVTADRRLQNRVRATAWAGLVVDLDRRETRQVTTG